MKSIWLVWAFVTVAGLALAGTKAELGMGKNPRTARVDAVAGADIYRINCQGCHGPARGGTGTALALAGILKRRSEQEVRRVIEEGRGRMPGFGNLKRAEMDALLGYLGQATRSVGRATVRPLGRVALGERLFRGNCASCHGSRSTRAGGPGCGMPLAGVTTRLSKQQIENIIRHGRCMMPSFARLKDSEVDAIYGHLKSLPAPEDASMTMGKVCPMVEDATRDEPTRAGCCGMWEPSRQVRGN